MMNKHSNVNPFTVEIVKDNLLSIGEEMFTALARSSMSPIIYEVLDYACGLTDRKGRLISQGNGVTSFIGMLSPMVQSIIEKFDGGKELYEGDIILINDPYLGGGSHLSDVGLVMPIFYEGEIVAYSANKGHWTEVGGKDAGSFTTDSTEIFQEGLQFSGIKLVEKGTINQGIVDIIQSNVRFPDLSIGDMWAQIAALKTGGKRFSDMCDKYGENVVTLSINQLLNQGKNYALKELKKIPKGEFLAEGYIEAGASKDKQYPIKVKVTITETNFMADFRGSHPQVNKPVNCSYYGLLASVRAMYLAIVKPFTDVNDGFFEPFSVITDRGSIISAERPAPVSMNFEGRIGGADLIWQAMAPNLPERLPAGHMGSVCSVVLSGNHHVTNNPFLIVEPSVGGWGAAQGMDGVSGQFCMGNGETYNVPIEIAESRYGVLIENYGLHINSAGAGEYLGGRGVQRSYKVLSSGQKLSTIFGRHSFKPWGMNGGHEGSPNYVTVEKSNKQVDGPYGVTARYELNKGDVVHLITATGGGYGSPLHRNPEQVLKDVRNGYISLKDAEDVYGVKVETDNWKITEVYPDR
ncbi:hydantoinase B/oxoprolinase family protein [Halobacillus shinanisalinarum]|uniref:Hydantoinase B/oxoprolinase family protein n=1 Tax=Halobacillus shinanisalinarum TaxID=2932258 RepID=A0ABY4GZZ5_9BACI|nr:hydantoinase B/oxoprolinase family protein [Halobacillus shinanisalinarum]UOQ92332.1 hydantoinase B/oxoprolinase family protein [Halobacillus shinanisalinarum]